MGGREGSNYTAQITFQDCDEFVIHISYNNQLQLQIQPVFSMFVLYGKRDTWLPCMERSYYRRPYAL